MNGPDREAQQVERRRRRRRLFALPIVLVLLAIAFKLVTMSWFSSRGAAAYDEAHYDRSLTEFDRLEVVNVIEPWRAPFGLGTARHRQGDLEGAEAAFRRALELAPERCDVRFNLVVTIEAQGDREPIPDIDSGDGCCEMRDFAIREVLANPRPGCLRRMCLCQ